MTDKKVVYNYTSVFPLQFDKTTDGKKRQDAFKYAPNLAATSSDRKNLNDPAYLKIIDQFFDDKNWHINIYLYWAHYVIQYLSPIKESIRRGYFKYSKDQIIDFLVTKHGARYRIIEGEDKIFDTQLPYTLTDQDKQFSKLVSYRLLKLDNSEIDKFITFYQERGIDLLCYEKDFVEELQLENKPKDQQNEYKRGKVKEALDNETYGFQQKQSTTLGEGNCFYLTPEEKEINSYVIDLTNSINDQEDNMIDLLPEIQITRTKDIQIKENFIKPLYDALYSRVNFEHRNTFYLALHGQKINNPEEKIHWEDSQKSLCALFSCLQNIGLVYNPKEQVKTWLINHFKYLYSDEFHNFKNTTVKRYLESNITSAADINFPAVEDAIKQIKLNK